MGEIYSYELKPLKLHASGLLKPSPGWSQCITAECMGDNDNNTAARLFGGYDQPVQIGSLDYTVPQSSGLYHGTPLTVTVYARAREASGFTLNAHITPTLNAIEGNSVNLIHVDWTDAYYEFDVSGWSWADIDNMKIGVILYPEDEKNVIDICEVWAIVKYEYLALPPPPPDDGVAAITHITKPSTFTPGTAFGIATHIRNDGGDDDLFIRVTNTDTSEIIGEHVLFVPGGETEDWVASVTLVQTTDFHGKIEAGHIE